MSMHWRDWKYLIAYIAPLSAWIGFRWGGWWSPSAMYVAFVLIPILELVTPASAANVPVSEEPSRASRRFFDLLLYANVPILYGLLWVYLQRITSGNLSVGEQIGMLLSMGVIIGASGINVGHELGHRASQFERVLAWLLLLPALYLHFYVEHNRGHHRWVATDRDPASARKGEWLYAFWIRSITGSWINAWRLEAERLRKTGKPAWHGSNQMILFHLVQVIYLIVIFSLWGWIGLAFAAGSALVGILLLETINYIEHYGLRRQKRPEGHYEKVQPWHSWNSDHELGRIFLYELTRHSDHHFKASRKYQVLRHFDDSPQLPFGYPGSMILALFPPLWRKVMDDRINSSPTR